MLQNMIKNASEISKIRFLFVTISYRQYNICIADFELLGSSMSTAKAMARTP